MPDIHQLSDSKGGHGSFISLTLPSQQTQIAFCTHDSSIPHLLLSLGVIHCTGLSKPPKFFAGPSLC